MNCQKGLNTSEITVHKAIQRLEKEKGVAYFITSLRVYGNINSLLYICILWNEC
jgi:hypothetical protein